MEYRERLMRKAENDEHLCKVLKTRMIYLCIKCKADKKKKMQKNFQKPP